MNSGGHDLIVFLGSTKIYFSDGNRILAFELPVGTIKDWDVVNKQSLHDILAAFINANNFEPSPITFVLSEPACFSKDLLIKDPAKLESEVADFLAAVPFNYVVSKNYNIGQGVRVIAANKDLIDDVAEVFEGKGFPLYAIVPAAIFPKEGVKTELDMEFVKTIGNSRELIRTGNMTTPKVLPPEVASATAGPVITNRRASSGFLPYLIGVGVLAVIVLVVLIIMRRGQ